MARASDAPGLIDTDIIIDAQRGMPSAVAFLTAQRTASGVHISIISAMELVIGCRNADELAQVQEFIRYVKVEATSMEASRTAYHLMESFFLSHGLLIPDALIAGTAITCGLTLYTKNVRHFVMIPNLVVVRPY